MSDVPAAPVVAAKATPVKKAKKAAKPKKPAAHPKYSDMIAAAIANLKERGGSSRQAILKYILKNFNVGANEKAVNSRLKLALRAGIKNESLKGKGAGATGSFRLGEKKQTKVKKAVKPKNPKAKSPKKVKKPKAAGEKKVKKAKKTKAKKPAAEKKAKAAKPKKAKVVKKPAAKKASKAKKSPAKPKKAAKSAKK